MSVKFHPLNVKQIVRETSSAITIHFQKPSAEFDYTSGQYLTLKLEVNGESLRRAYSLCSSPVTDADLAVTVKRVEDGRVSNWLNTQLREGQTLEVMPPMGNFTLTPYSGSPRHIVLLGGGSGITPLMSILKTVLATEPESKITLLYGNRNLESIIFHKALTEMEAQHAGRLRVIYTLDTAGADWTGLTGYLDRHLVLRLCQDIIQSDNLPKEYYLCGPGPMMDEVKIGLNFLGVPQNSVHQEFFSAKLPDPDASSEASIESGGSDYEAKLDDYDVTVIIDGTEKTVHVKKQLSVLDAVIEDGLDPPYACQMGVCCTCRAKLISGKVEMDEDEGLSDQEIEEGYILTCQSHPLTPDVKLEYM